MPPRFRVLIFYSGLLSACLLVMAGSGCSPCQWVCHPKELRKVEAMDSTLLFLQTERPCVENCDTQTGKDGEYRRGIEFWTVRASPAPIRRNVTNDLDDLDEYHEEAREMVFGDKVLFSAFVKAGRMLKMNVFHPATGKTRIPTVTLPADSFTTHPSVRPWVIESEFLMRQYGQFGDSLAKEKQLSELKTNRLFLADLEAKKIEAFEPWIFFGLDEFEYFEDCRAVGGVAFGVAKTSDSTFRIFRKSGDILSREHPLPRKDTASKRLALGFIPDSTLVPGTGIEFLALNGFGPRTVFAPFDPESLGIGEWREGDTAMPNPITIENGAKAFRILIRASGDTVDLPPVAAW